MRWNLWGSSSDNSEAGPSQSTDAAAQTSQQAQTSTSTPTPAASTRAPEPPLSKYDRALKEEQKIQDEQYPNYEDIPKCMTLL